MKSCIAYVLGVTLLVCCDKNIVMDISGGPTRYVDSHGAVTGSTVCEITVEKEPDELLVILNGIDTMALESHSGSEYVFNDNDIPIAGNESAVVIYADDQTVNAISILPDDFEINEPGDSVVVDTSLTIQWTAATHAEWYLIEVVFLYFDTSNTFLAVDTSIITTEVSVEIAGDWFTAFIGEGDMLIDVYARNGPHPDSSEGNIEGAEGTWVASYGRRKRVTVFSQ